MPTGGGWSDHRVEFLDSGPSNGSTLLGGDRVPRKGRRVTT